MRIRPTLVAATLIVLLLGLPTAGSDFTNPTSNDANSFATAASFCTAPGSTTVIATGDASIGESAPNNNFGTTNPNHVWSGAGTARRTLVQFSLPAIPARCAVTSATLSLYATTSTTGRTIEAYRNAALWNEASVTWNNQPGPVGTPALHSTDSTTGWKQWTVTSQVLAMYSGSNTGFLIKDANEAAGGAQQRYTSDEAASNQPTLTVIWG